MNGTRTNATSIAGTSAGCLPMTERAMPDEMLGEFISEAADHLATAANLLLQLAKASSVDMEQVNACFRALHTIKGCSGFLDLHRIKSLAHAGEQVLDALRSGELTGSPITWDLLLATVSRLELVLVGLEMDDREPTGNDSDITSSLEELLCAPAASPVAQAAITPIKSNHMTHPPTASLDACIAGIIASDPEDTAAILRQVGRIESFAQRQGWSGDLLTAVQAVRQVADRLATDSNALADVYVAIQALQDRCHHQSAPETPARDTTRSEARPSTAVHAHHHDVLAKPHALAQDFVSECNELLSTAEDLALSCKTFDDDQINAVFRSFHTIKGMAAYLEQPAIEHEAHAIEDRLLPVRDGHAPAGQDFIVTVLTGVDRLRGLLAPRDTAQESPSETPSLGDLLVDMGVSREVIEETARHLKTDEHLADKLVQTGKVARQVMEQAVQAQAAARTGDGFSRVATSKLEEMVNMVGELLIAQAMVVSDPELNRFPNLAAAVQRQSRILRNLQVLSLSMRMVPLRATFQKMARAVHDTARKLSKEINYQTAGEDTEIDRTLAEAMADPLLHMVRNAVDHGIESAEARSRSGKPGTGTVKLEAFHAGDNVVIQLTDDGGGMDPQRLRAKAIEKGLIPADKVLSEVECFDLVFLPGFSTAAQVTDVSGRGVGMDVVRRQVRSANGSVQIQSRIGFGTVFTIRLPLTTAIMDTMLLRCGEERFLIPVSAVVNMLRPDPGQVASVMTHGRVLSVRGRQLPVVRLGDTFAITDHQHDPQQSLLLVIENRGHDFALQVDEVLGQRQVVIKPFDHAVIHHPGVSGSAILGDGRVALILNPARLLAGSATDDGT